MTVSVRPADQAPTSRRRFGLSCARVAASCCAASLALAAIGQGIPEPELIMYGAIKNVQNNANLRLGHGPLTCVLQPAGGGNPITVSTTLTNINDQFSYILRIPCETGVPGYPVSSNVVSLTGAGISFSRAQITWFSNVLSFNVPALSNTIVATTNRGRIERVDLSVSLPVIIGPNGLPLDWELLYFGYTGIDPFADPDGDGLNNFAEYRAGTNPLDSLSGLRFTEIRSLPAGIQLKWTGAEDRRYALQRSASPQGIFDDIHTGISSTPPENIFLDTTVAGAGLIFYRLRIDDAFSVPTSPPFWLTGIRSDPLGGIRINWLSSQSRSYAVQRSTNLASEFSSIATGVMATPPTNTFRDSNAVGAGPYFYRLKLDP